MSSCLVSRRRLTNLLPCGCRALADRWSLFHPSPTQNRPKIKKKKSNSIQCSYVRDRSLVMALRVSAPHRHLHLHTSTRLTALCFDGVLTMEMHSRVGRLGHRIFNRRQPPLSCAAKLSLGQWWSPLSEVPMGLFSRGPWWERIRNGTSSRHYRHHATLPTYAAQDQRHTGSPGHPQV